MLCFYATLAAALVAADPAPEALPAPRSVAVEPMPFRGYYRRNPYDVWQAYSIGRQGYWLPRVDYAPGYGYYYVYNGQPYLYAPLNQRWVSPSIQGTPYRSLPDGIVFPTHVLPPPTVVASTPVRPTAIVKKKRAVAAAPDRMPYCED